jgi:hypothetical protein
VGKKGHKSRRGKGEIYNEPKSRRKVILLTDTAFQILRRITVTDRISASEAIERLLRESSTDHSIEIDDH